MKFDKVIKEADAEVYGSGTQERVIVRIGNQKTDLGSLRNDAPMTHSAIIKAINYAKKQGFDISANKAPADIVIMGNGSIKITDDVSGKVIQPSLSDLGFTPQQIGTIKAENE